MPLQLEKAVMHRLCFPVKPWCLASVTEAFRLPELQAHRRVLPRSDCHIRGSMRKQGFPALVHRYSGAQSAVCSSYRQMVAGVSVFMKRS